jgi:hypothetical protein
MTIRRAACAAAIVSILAVPAVSLAEEVLWTTTTSADFRLLQPGLPDRDFTVNFPAELWLAQLTALPINTSGEDVYVWKLEAPKKKKTKSSNPLYQDSGVGGSNPFFESDSLELIYNNDTTPTSGPPVFTRSLTGLTHSDKFKPQGISLVLSSSTNAGTPAVGFDSPTTLELLGKGPGETPLFDPAATTRYFLPAPQTLTYLGALPATAGFELQLLSLNFTLTVVPEPTSLALLALPALLLTRRPRA